MEIFVENVKFWKIFEFFGFLTIFWIFLKRETLNLFEDDFYKAGNSFDRIFQNLTKFEKSSLENLTFFWKL